MAVNLDTNAAGFSASVPAKLFSTAPYYVTSLGSVFDVSADGRRFLMVKEAPTTKPAEPPRLIVATNWVHAEAVGEPAKP